jgi:phosphoglycolate phosphatase-like HAD superfamily hydrolase
MLLLFDIDGTLLVGAAQAHRAAVVEAVGEVFDLANRDPQGVAAAGRTDVQIARAVAMLGGVASQRFDERRGELEATCVEAFARICPPSLAAHVGPGVIELLDALAARQDVQLALLTGNLEPIGRLKLARAGIGKYFAPGQGAFGSDAEQRELLGPIARIRAGTPDAPYPREQTIVIGDTPLDIACARADGLHAIAIATGPHPASDLTAADHVVHNAFELRVLLESAS